MSGKRRTRPGILGVLGMMIVNAVATAIVLKIVFALFGVTTILETRVAAFALAHAAAKWSVFWPLIPGAAICFGCLWFWLILVGRSRGVSWIGACLYGALIALTNVPLSGFLNGLLHGSPLLGLLWALLSLLVLLMQPSLVLAIATFGIVMGLFNGMLATHWIEAHRPRD